MASRAREERKRLANASKKAACATDEQLRELSEELKGRTKELDSATEVIRDLRECLERERAAAAAARSKHALQLKHAEERVAEATQTARKDMEQERQRNLSKLQHEYDRLNRRSATLQQDIVAFTDQQRKYQQDVSRQQESFAKQQDELRRQQDELRRQQDELRRQQNELRKQQQEPGSAGGMVVRPHDLSVVLDTLDRTTLQADTLNATRRQLAASNEMLQTANAKLSQDMQKLTRENVVLARANVEHAKLVDVLNKQFLTLQSKCQAVESSLSACERVNADLRNTTQGLRYQNEALHQELARLSRSAAGRIDRDNSCRPSPDDASDQEDLRIAQKDLAKISTIW
jgi:IgA-specific serine endopeptidase